MLVMAAVGDIIAGDHPLYLGIGVKSIIEKKETYIFECSEKYFSDADIVFGNIETVLLDCNNRCYEDVILRGHSSFAKQLKRANFTILNVANNHIQQHGRQGLLSTIDLLRKEDIDIIGVDSLQPKIMVIEDIKLGYLGYSLRPEQYANSVMYSTSSPRKILSDIVNTKEKVDHLIISLHWGDEYMSFPSSWQIEFAHQLIDHGANIILGHHPHVLQCIEKYRKGIIAYSLGNFVSDMCQKQAKETIILKIIFDKLEISYDVIPCRINKNYQPTPLKGDEKKKALTGIKKLSNFPTVSQKGYNKLVKNSINSFRKEYRRYLIKNWHGYPLRYLIEIINDFIRRRLHLKK